MSLIVVLWSAVSGIAAQETSLLGSWKQVPVWFCFVLFFSIPSSVLSGSGLGDEGYCVGKLNQIKFHKVEIELYV